MSGFVHMEAALCQVYGHKYNLHMELALEQTKEWAFGSLPALWDCYDVWLSLTVDRNIPWSHSSVYLIGNSSYWQREEHMLRLHWLVRFWLSSSFVCHFTDGSLCSKWTINKIPGTTDDNSMQNLDELPLKFKPIDSIHICTLCAYLVLISKYGNMFHFLHSVYKAPTAAVCTLQ